MTKISVNALAGVMETLLPVLYARVVESRREDAIFNDPIAEDWVSRIDYDFAQFDNSTLNNLGVAIRTEIFDEFASDFLAEHPQATVVNIAAGLDTRYYRMDNGQLRWIELDLPQSIVVRQQVMQETGRHMTLAASALDDDWVQHIPKDQPCLFIVEGLLMYFTEAQVQHFLTIIADNFPGAQLLLEVMAETMAKLTHLNDAISKTDATFKWGIRDTSQIATWHPRLQFVAQVSIYERHEERWLATDVNWKGKRPADYANKTIRIVKLNVD